MRTHRSKSVPSENNCLAKNNSSARNLQYQTLLADLPAHSRLSLLGERHTVAVECKSDLDLELNHFN